MLISASVGNMSQPPPAQAAMPSSSIADGKTASYRLLPCINCIIPSRSVLDDDLDCCLAQLNGIVPSASGTIDEGDTDDENVVASDLQGMKLLQIVKG